MKHKKYVDSCRTLTILKQDSGLLPPPKESWNTFTPQLGDIAYVSNEHAEYEFNGEEWIKKEDKGGSNYDNYGK